MEEQKPKEKATPAQRNYLLSRLKTMFEANKARILGGEEVVLGQLIAKAREERTRKTGSARARKLYAQAKAAIDTIDWAVNEYKRLTGVWVWGNSTVKNLLKSPLGELPDRYQLKRPAQERTRVRLEELLKLYLEAKGQILFKDRTVMLDYIEAIERKAERI